jgi:hypothetical protein
MNLAEELEATATIRRSSAVEPLGEKDTEDE